MNRPDKRNSLTQYSNRHDHPAPTRAESLSTNLQTTRWPLAPLAQFSTRIDRRSLVLYSTSTNLLIRVSTQFLYTGLHNRTQLCTVSHYQFSTSTMIVPYTVQNQCTCTCIHVLMYVPCTCSRGIAYLTQQVLYRNARRLHCIVSISKGAVLTKDCHHYEQS